MTDKPLPEDEPGAQERFERAIKTALATPRKPHKISDKSIATPKKEGAKRSNVE